MAGLNDLVKKAKDVVEDRGGTSALKEDADELKKIARGEGSFKEKAKQAAEALKDPGAEGPERTTTRPPATPPR